MSTVSNKEGAMGGLSNGRQIRCGGEVLEYTERGEGEPIVLLHAGVFSDWFVPVAATEALANARAIAAVIKGGRVAWRRDDHRAEPYRAR
jgi:hypothetical protein